MLDVQFVVIMTSNNRTKVVVAGAGGSIGSAVCQDLARDYDVTAVVGSRERLPPESDAGQPFSWRYCEPFSRKGAQKAVAGCDVLIYLFHTRIPTARLDQAECENMDLLIADNFARAAHLEGVKQIIYLADLHPEGEASLEFWTRRDEITEALSIYGTPLTVLRAGLVVAPGSNTLRLLVNLATRLPVVLIPSWADNRQQPIAVVDVVRAVRYCLGKQEAYGQEYDIGGPVVLTLRELLRRAASVLKRKQFTITVPFFPKRLFAGYLRLLNRHAHPALIKLAVEALSHDAVVRDNPLQQFIAEKAMLAREVLDPYLKKYGQIPPNPRQPFLKKHIAGLRARGNVRSIQRIVLQQGRDATWVADTFFQWLPHFARPFVICEVDDTGTCRIFIRFPRLNLITLTFKPNHSSTDRRMYFITGGLLARGHGDLTPRFEFRDVLKGRFTIAAIHDFRPRLPWGFYSLTQAVIHLIAMRRFQKLMAEKGEIEN